MMVNRIGIVIVVVFDLMAQSIQADQTTSSAIMTPKNTEMRVRLQGVPSS
jgi:hypothetical protein